MVIPPSCPGLNVEILVDGQPLQEYDDVDKNPVPPNTVTKYIEARSNVNFSIRAKFDAKFPFPAGHVQFKTSLDQQHTQGNLIPAQYLFHPEGTMNEGYFSHTGGETHDLYKYCFVALDLGMFSLYRTIRYRPSLRRDFYYLQLNPTMLK
jgi:hypothetical protein